MCKIQKPVKLAAFCKLQKGQYCFLLATERL